MTEKSQIYSTGQQTLQTRLRVCSIDTLNIDPLCRLENTGPQEAKVWKCPSRTKHSVCVVYLVERKDSIIMIKPWVYIALFKLPKVIDINAIIHSLL